MLCMAFACTFLLPACASTGPGGGGETAIARSIVQVAAMQQLAKADNAAEWNAKHAQLTSLAVVLEAVNTEGFTAKTLRPIIAAKLQDKPYALLLMDLILLNAQTPGTNALNNVMLASVSDGLKAALDMPQPEWPSGKESV